MNIRQQLYKKYRLEAYSKYTSARKAGYSHSYATQAKNIDNRINMDYWLEEAGLTDKALSNHAKEGMSATRVISAVKGNEANGATCDFIDVPDWNNRHKYYETTLKLRNKISNKPLIDQSQHQHYTFKYERLDGDNVRASRRSNGSMGTPGKVEGLGGRPSVRKDIISNPRTDEKGPEPSEG